MPEAVRARISAHCCNHNFVFISAPVYSLQLFISSFDKFAQQC